MELELDAPALVCLLLPLVLLACYRATAARSDANPYHVGGFASLLVPFVAFLNSLERPPGTPGWVFRVLNRLDARVFATTGWRLVPVAEQERCALAESLERVGERDNTVKAVRLLCAELARPPCSASPTAETPRVGSAGATASFSPELAAFWAKKNPAHFWLNQHVVKRRFKVKTSKPYTCEKVAETRSNQCTNDENRFKKSRTVTSSVIALPRTFPLAEFHPDTDVGTPWATDPVGLVRSSIPALAASTPSVESGRQHSKVHESGS